MLTGGVFVLCPVTQLFLHPSVTKCFCEAVPLRLIHSRGNVSKRIVANPPSFPLVLFVPATVVLGGEQMPAALLTCGV